VIGVTGTKGKSTTASLLAHLASVVVPTQLAGNIGRPALDLLDETTEGWVVLELSSYQIADLSSGPEVAVITNLYKEHADWHGDERTYRDEKLRIFKLPGVRAAVYPVGDPDIAAAAAGCAMRISFGGPQTWHLTEGGIQDGEGSLIPWDVLPLRGAHNALNLCASLSALVAAGIPCPPLPDSLAGVKPLPHRLQTVYLFDEVEWVDDSISTTPESSLAAIAAFSDQPLVLVAGGLDRGQDYDELGRIAAKRAVGLVTLPSTGARLAAAARRSGLAEDRIVEAGDMEMAVLAAAALAPAGSVVLLSPAAPSYNSYRNFEERGDHFAALARSSAR
jgi:UDP-N-acetylmuramoylalanine--D-glutamate ligase